MSGGAVLRTVEVSNQEKQSYGTGCLIAPGLILTAHHVALPGGGSVVTVRDTTSAGFTEAVMVWESTELDAVLLKTDRTLVGAGLGIVRWGELACDAPGRRPVCSMTGFPKAMRRKASALAGQYVDDLKTVEGTIAPHTGSRSKLYGLEVDGAVPAQAKHWQGLSGAGVFCNGVLIGLTRLVSREWDRNLLMVLPLSHLLAADGFPHAIAAHTGMTPHLQPADLRPLMDTEPDPTLSSSYLLDPRSQVTDLTGMSTLVHKIKQWCKSPHRIDVAAVTGLGGTGKSRLLTEVLHQLTTNSGDQRPWSGGFLAEHPTRTDYEILATSSYPLLLAVDLAETRLPQIRDLMAALAGSHDGAPIRVLLLARGFDSWWPALRRHLRTRNVSTVEHSFNLTPDDALDGLSPEHIYVAAKEAFARRIRLLQQAGHGDDTWPDIVPAEVPRHYGAGIEHASGQPVIYHHIAALADVLAHANPEFAVKDHPMEVLLANEVEYVRRVAESRLPAGTVDDKLLRTLVTAQFLAGARTAQEGRAAVRAGYDVHHRGYGITAPPDAGQLAALDDVLSAAYPAADGAHWGAVGEPLAAAWLAEVETDSGEEFIEAFLQHDSLAPEQRHQTLSTVARTAHEQPGLAAGAHRAVAATPERLLPLAAQTVTAELDTDQALQWLAGLEHTVADRTADPDFDPETRQWASCLISETQERIATDRDDIEELIDAAPTPAAATPQPGQTSTHRALVKPQVGRLTRFTVTVLGLGHLALVGAVPATVALSTDAGNDGWILWLFVPLNMFMHLTVASVFGGRQLGTVVLSWPLPLVTIGLTTSFTFAADRHLPAHWPPQWLLWPGLFAFGLTALTFAWRINFGQLQDTPRTPTPTADKPRTPPAKPPPPMPAEGLALMNRRWELLRRRVYGAAPDGHNQHPLPWRTYAALIGGPLDGLLLDITDWTKDKIDTGAALSAELGRFPGGSAVYAPHRDEPRAPAPGVTCCFYHSGDMPRPADE
ncbi:serine protease [Streptomyces sp. NPDC102360]|uniref:S1 family peptidase n=1 Tax=Streptomyces sp. NPDC102360 TaxID=3366160 RepID=UPI0038091BE4